MQFSWDSLLVMYQSVASKPLITGICHQRGVLSTDLCQSVDTQSNYWYQSLDKLRVYGLRWPVLGHQEKFLVNIHQVM